MNGNQNPAAFWSAILVLCACCFVISVIYFVCASFARDAKIKQKYNMTSEEFRAWKTKCNKQALKAKRDWWNSPMTRGDWFVWKLFGR